VLSGTKVVAVRTAPSVPAEARAAAVTPPTRAVTPPTRAATVVAPTQSAAKAPASVAKTPAPVVTVASAAVPTVSASHTVVLVDTAIVLVSDPSAEPTVALTIDPVAEEGESPEIPDLPVRAPSNVPPLTIQRLRPADRRGINVFEAPKNDTMPYTGFRLAFGAAFTQQFQALDHRNTSDAIVTNGVNSNQLMSIGHGFNNAVANAYLNVQVARGVRVALTSYLSSRHHNEVWIKDGYALVDASPVDFAPANKVMEYLTLKVGHFEINYGDAHFRRTDNGNAMFNPLVGNYIMDAFTTEVGGEAYVHGRGRLDGAFVMAGITNGEVRGTILNRVKRAPAFYGKAGMDRTFGADVRARLSGTLFSQSRANSQTLYSGDRAGSRYYDVLENTTSSESAQAWSGGIQPFSGPSAGLHAAVVNPFLKYKGLEYFGNFERAHGRGVAEATVRTVTQLSNELTYRIFNDALYVSGRYNTVSGRLAGLTDDIRVRRTQVGGGWFITPLILAKLEYVNQKYVDFPSADIRNGGRFQGFLAEGVIAF
jgi:hypothetical protein